MPGLVAFYDTSGQETERVYSYNPGARTGPGSKTRMMMSPSVSDPEKVWRYLHSFRYNTNSVTSACLSVYPSLHLSICLSVGLFLWRSRRLTARIGHGLGPGEAQSLKRPHDVTVSNLPPAHHCHPPSHTHYFIPGSKLTFSTNFPP